jgi:hypothetical protein
MTAAARRGTVFQGPWGEITMTPLRLIGLALTLTLLTTSATSETPHAMTAADLQKICVGSDAVSKAGCRFYILGITQGIEAGMSIADGKTQGGRPCIPDDASGAALELVVKMKLGEDLMVFPADRDLDASGFVAGVMIATFSCSKAGQHH